MEGNPYFRSGPHHVQSSRGALRMGFKLELRGVVEVGVHWFAASGRVDHKARWSKITMRQQPNRANAVAKTLISMASTPPLFAKNCHSNNMSDLSSSGTRNNSTTTRFATRCNASCSTPQTSTFVSKNWDHSFSPQELEASGTTRPSQSTVGET